MKRYKWFLLGIVIFFSGIAFVPVIAFPWKEKIDWQSFANAYNTVKVFLPIILR